MLVYLNRTSLATLFVFLCLGAAGAQDTNFATGPQYLAHGSPLFARPISTPTMSLVGPPLEIGASNASDGLIAGAQNRNVLPPNPDALPNIDLFPIYYGALPPSVIEITFPSEPLSNPLPASILDGVVEITTVETVRERGYGMTPAEAAAFGKAKTQHVPRVYTNADIDRLPGS